MKDLKEQRDAAQRQCDHQGQHILSLEANLSAADDKRRRLRKELAEVRPDSLSNQHVYSDCTAEAAAPRRQCVQCCTYETF
jgi:flagellar motility protein MotE (MotC chaperone)